MLKSVNDYLPELIAQFPTVPPEDVKRAVEYGWRMLYYYNLRGCDTLISSTKYRYWFYCGQLTRDSIKHYNYYRRMLRRKLRVLYSKKVKEWDGYYYIGLTEDEYKSVVKSTTGRGRKKKNFIILPSPSLQIKLTKEISGIINVRLFIINPEHTATMEIAYTFDQSFLPELIDQLSKKYYI